MQDHTDGIERYLEVYEELRRSKKWTESIDILRLASLSLMALPIEDLRQRLDEASDTLKAKSGWFGPLNSSMRQGVAAMAIRRDVDPAALHDGVE